MNPIRIGLLIYDEVQALDIVGPVDAFTAARLDEGRAEEQRCYETFLIGLTHKPCTSESGIVFQPHCSIRTAPPLDTLIVPGGRSMRLVPETSARISEWIRSQAIKTRRIASVCTGIYGLAPTGLLDGREVTTHWRFAHDLSQRFPNLRVIADAIFLTDGHFYTSAGITAGIDLSLALIEEDYGAQVALAVARELVVYLKRPGGQEQYSEPLQFQSRSTDRFADLAIWIKTHLEGDLSVEALAERACLSPRHFGRRFRDAFGLTPAAFVEELRLNEARRRLTMANQNIKGVADSVGFKSPDTFSRAFERRFGVKPSSYRHRFSHANKRRE